MTYVTLDKNTKEPQGFASIHYKDIKDWEERFDLVEVDDSYRSKQGYEIKYENGKVRLATQQEIDAYKQQQETALKEATKEQAMETLGITQENLDRLKTLSVTL